MQKTHLVLALISLLTILNTAFAEPEKEAGSGSAEDERAAYLDPELKKQIALAKTLKEHETVWLELSYPETTETRKVLAISSPSLIADEKGAALLLHDKEQHADWPEVIRPLRKSLPKSGWLTLSVNLPNETKFKAPERVLQAKSFDQVMMNANLKSNLDSGLRVRNELAEKSGSIDSESTEANGQVKNNDEKPVDIDLALEQKQPDSDKTPYNVRSLSHIEKAYDYLKTKNYQNVVLIAYGRSAELALEYIKTHQEDLNSPGFALILIEPILPETHLLDLSEWLGQDFQGPILDMINRNDPKALEAAEIRKFSVLRTGAKKYRQDLITVNNNKIFDENLSRRVQAWLKTNAPGP